MSDVVSEPNDSKFVYNRNYPPLFFARPTKVERDIWKHSTESVTREYFRNSRQFKLGHDVPLSNGITCGEFSMYLVTKTHLKRTTSNY